LLWVATGTLAGLAWLAVRAWRISVWVLAAFVLPGPLCLLADELGWIPLIAAPVGGPLLLVGITGVWMAPPRSDTSPSRR
jgi:hypothetical protein